MANDRLCYSVPVPGLIFVFNRDAILYLTYFRFRQVMLKKLGSHITLSVVLRNVSSALLSIIFYMAAPIKEIKQTVMAVIFQTIPLAMSVVIHINNNNN